MEKSKVYFTDFRTVNGVGLPTKLSKLCRKAGILDMDLENKFVAIKIHFGELGNIAYLRPNYAKAVADLVKEGGGMPFLTDCNTLYPGSRKNALEHISCAQERCSRAFFREPGYMVLQSVRNGFPPSSFTTSTTALA